MTFILMGSKTESIRVSFSFERLLMLLKLRIRFCSFTLSMIAFVTREEFCKAMPRLRQKMSDWSWASWLSLKLAWEQISVISSAEYGLGVPSIYAVKFEWKKKTHVQLEKYFKTTEKVRNRFSCSNLDVWKEEKGKRIPCTSWPRKSVVPINNYCEFGSWEIKFNAEC